MMTLVGWARLDGAVDTEVVSADLLAALSLSHITPSTSLASSTTMDSQREPLQSNETVGSLHYSIMKKKDETFIGSCFCYFLLSMAGITALIQLGSNMFIAMDRITIGTFYSVCSLQLAWPWSQIKFTKKYRQTG